MDEETTNRTVSTEHLSARRHFGRKGEKGWSSGRAPAHGHPPPVAAQPSPSKAPRRNTTQQHCKGKKGINCACAKPFGN